MVAAPARPARIELDMSQAQPNGGGDGYEAAPAEEAVLGALLFDHNAWQTVYGCIGQDDFGRSDHCLIFGTIEALAVQGLAHDLVTVGDCLDRAGKLEDAGGLVYLHTLVDNTPGAANVADYAKLVRERAALRRLQRIGNDVCTGVRSGQAAGEIARLARRSLEELETSISNDAAAGWPDPVNLLQQMAAPPFTGEELPAALSRFPLAYARATGFDPSLTLSAAVATAAAALTDEFQIVGDSRSKWFQQARLWFLGIGRPGAGKTPAQRAMLAPLWNIQHLLREGHKRNAELSDTEKPAPTPRVIVADATIEALSEALRDNPRGLLIATDEFESWLGGLDAYRRSGVSRDRGEWLRIFDGGPHTIERVQRGSVYVENWGASILTATTPAALAKLTRNLPEDGLIQRFLPIIGAGRVEAVEVPDIEACRGQFAELINRLYAATPRAHAGCVALSTDAQSFLQTWMRQATIAQEAFGAVEPALESHLAKYPTLLLRLALTFHAANVVSHEHEHGRDLAAFPVPSTTLQLAASFLKRARLHALAVYAGQKGAGEAFDVARDIARAVLARGWERVERRELSQGVRTYRNAERECQDTAIHLLVDLGWLRPSESGYRAKQARLDVNPRLAGKFADLAQRERERRAIVREAIADSVEARRAEKSEP